MEQLDLWSAGDDSRMVGSEHASPAAEPEPTRVAEVAAEQTPPDASALVLDTAHAEGTRAAYASDWRVFARWCSAQGEQSLPASAVTLTRYLDHLAHSGRKLSTIRRARIAISVLHGQQGHPRPDRDACVRLQQLGADRLNEAQQEGATPLQLQDLERMVSVLGSSTRDDRDRALLLVGFGGAFRASELVSLDLSDLFINAAAAHIRLRSAIDARSANSPITQLPRASEAQLCPVRALERWLVHVEGPGPLFRPAYGARVSQDRLCPRAVSRAVHRAAERAGLSGDYSSHSLRSGLATSAHARGLNPRDIQAHGRWKSLRSLHRYLEVHAETVATG